MLSILSNHGILGLNARNLLFIRPYNPKTATAFADDKLKTKAFLAARGIPTARIYAKIETREQARHFDASSLPDECVLKPNFGFGGEGILVFKGRDKHDQFLIGGKEALSDKGLRHHMEDIIEGMYSLGGRRDVAFFEQILYPHECFARLRPAGLPDVRVIVFNLVPVMAMLRVPTAQSQGKANIHMGGIGIGIDLSKGITTHAVQYGKRTTELPHGGSPSGIEIPFWDEILLIATRIQHITNIGFLACDITIDAQMGPVLLEVNARAGLMVQIANLAPLRTRLERVKGVKVSSPEKGVQIGKDLFGSTPTKKQSVPVPDRPILGTHETLTLSGDGATLDIPCLIAPEHEHTVIAPDLIDDLRAKHAAEVKNGKDRTYIIKGTIAGRKIQTVATVGDVPGENRVLIGRRALKGFLIDPTREKPPSKRTPAVKSDLRAIDKLLSQIDRNLLLLKHLKPVNLTEERRRAERDHLYNPLFQYRDRGEDLEHARHKIEQPIQAASPLGILLEKKRCELTKRIDLLRSRGNAVQFTQNSRALFGSPTAELLQSAKRALSERLACELPPPEDELLSAEEAQKVFEQALKKYSLHDWQVIIRPHVVADITVGPNNIYIREGARFSHIRLDALIAHEIETHILTAENGAQQPFTIFRRGTAGYLDTQEGLAVYNQNRIYGPFADVRYNPPRNVLAVAFGLEHSFGELRQYLEEQLGYGSEKALNQTIAIKRGLIDTSEPGGFTKSLVYLRGLRAVQAFVRSGGDLKDLYIGKISLEDLDLIRKIPGMQEPVLLPEFLRKEA